MIYHSIIDLFIIHDTFKIPPNLPLQREERSPIPAKLVPHFYKGGVGGFVCSSFPCHEL